MKVKLSIIILLVGLLFTANISASAEQNLTEEEIQERLQQISNEYELNEPFSEEDAEFVKEHAMPTQLAENWDSLDHENLEKELKELEQSQSENMSTMSSGTGRVGTSNWLMSGSNTTATATGYVTVEINLFNHSIRHNGGLTTKTQSGNSVSRIGNSVQLDAYGAVGSDGKIGLIASRSLENSCSSSSSCGGNKVNQFTGAVAWYNIYGKFWAGETEWSFSTVYRVP